MAAPVSPVQFFSVESAGVRRAAAPSSGGPDFANALSDAFSQASASEKAADVSAKQFADGDPNVGIHEVMIAAEKASISLRFAVTLKNKMLEAYRDLMNTQV